MIELIKDGYAFIFSTWYWSFIFSFLSFTTMYGIGIILSTILIQYFKEQGKIYAIQHALKKGQIKNEIKNSFVSIFIFSLQTIPLQWLLQQGYIQVSFDVDMMLLWQIPALFLWNELHFYMVHYILHQPMLFRKIHYIHHLSKEPTLFSIYSFHWIEAFLLGTVIFFPLVLYNFNVVALMSLPVLSIILNLLGHCNHESTAMIGKQNWWRFTFRHTMHHQYSQGNYGFMLPWFDKIFKTALPKQKIKY